MKKVMCILSDGFEDVEAIGTIAFLRRAKIEVDIFSLHETMASGSYQTTIANLKNIKEANACAYDVLFLPGGKHYAELESNENVISLSDAPPLAQNAEVRASCSIRLMS